MDVSHFSIKLQIKKHMTLHTNLGFLLIDCLPLPEVSILKARTFAFWNFFISIFSI